MHILIRFVWSRTSFPRTPCRRLRHCLWRPWSCRCAVRDCNDSGPQNFVGLFCLRRGRARSWSVFEYGSMMICGMWLMWHINMFMVQRSQPPASFETAGWIGRYALLASSPVVSWLRHQHRQRHLRFLKQKWSCGWWEHLGQQISSCRESMYIYNIVYIIYIYI